MPFEETCRTMGTIMGKCGKSRQEEQRICKSCLMILLRFEEISLHCRNMNIVFISCAELWVAFFEVWPGLWAPNLNKNGTSPSKICPPPRVPSTRQFVRFLFGEDCSLLI